MKPYHPRPYAPLGNAHLASGPRTALWAKPGMGKTVITLTHIAGRIKWFGDSSRTLIIGPKRVAETVWAEEVGKWEHLSGLEVACATGPEQQRFRALSRDVPITTINYENLAWLRRQFPPSAWPFKRVIADESTKLKNFRVEQGVKRGRALFDIAHGPVQEWINLTGTPASNGMRDLWGQMWFLDRGHRLGRSFSAFEQRWFGYKRAKDALSKKVGVVPVVQQGAQDEIMARVKDLCLTLDPKDWFDLADPVVTQIDVQLPPKPREVYRKLERNMFAELKALGVDKHVEVFNAAALTNKCLQLAGGAAWTGETGSGEWAVVHEEKLDALQELIEELQEPVLVAYHYKPELKMLQQRFPYAALLSTDAGMADFKEGRANIGLMHPASLGHGVDGLQHRCRAIVFFAQDWNLEDHDQAIERVGPMRQLQAGMDRNVLIYYLVAADTLDEAVMERRAGKRAVQDILMDYMKAKT